MIIVSSVHAHARTHAPTHIQRVHADPFRGPFTEEQIGQWRAVRGEAGLDAHCSTVLLGHDGI